MCNVVINPVHGKSASFVPLESTDKSQGAGLGMVGSEMEWLRSVCERIMAPKRELKSRGSSPVHFLTSSGAEVLMQDFAGAVVILWTQRILGIPYTGSSSSASPGQLLPERAPAPGRGAHHSPSSNLSCQRCRAHTHTHTVRCGTNVLSMKGRGHVAIVLRGYLGMPHSVTPRRQSRADTLSTRDLEPKALSLSLSRSRSRCRGSSEIEETEAVAPSRMNM